MTDTNPLKRLPIVDLPRALIEAGYESAPYRRIYCAAVDSIIPATRSKTGRWTFDPEDLPAIAEAMGLSRAAQ